MGKILFFERLKKWFDEEMDWSAIGERLFQKNTLYGLGVALSTLGIWKIAPEKLLAIEGLFIFIWSLWQVGHNKKKADQKKLGEAVKFEGL